MKGLPEGEMHIGKSRVLGIRRGGRSQFSSVRRFRMHCTSCLSAGQGRAGKFWEMLRGPAVAA